MSTKKEFPAVTIDSLHEKERGPIWVLNTSMKTNPPGADIFISVATGKAGQTIIVTVPRTWLPINLNEQAPRADVLDSQQFLRAVSTGVITLISAEEAAEKTGSSGAPAERARLEQVKNAIRNAALTEGGKAFNESIEKVGPDGSLLSPTTDPTAKSVSAASMDFSDDAPSAASAEVTVTFKAWVNKLNGITDVNAAINEVALRGEFDNTEMRYIVDNVKHSRIRQGFVNALASAAAASSGS